MIRPPPISTLFPYTTLSRSPLRPAVNVHDDRPLPRELRRVRLIQEPRDLPPVERLPPDQLRLDERRRVQRSEEHTSELQSPCNLVCRLLLEKKKEITSLTLA